MTISKFIDSVTSITTRLELEEISPYFQSEDLELNDNQTLSMKTFTGADCLVWLSSSENLKASSKNKDKSRIWSAIQHAFNKFTDSGRGTISAETISKWASSSEAKKAIYGLDTLSQMRSALEKRMHRGHGEL